MNGNVHKFICAVFFSFAILGKLSIAFSDEIPLSSFKVSPFALHPGEPAVEVPFDVDISRPFLVDVVSPSDAFTVTLTTPQGEEVSSSNVISFNGEYTENELVESGLLALRNSAFLAGFHLVYYMQNPVQGSWKATIRSKNIPVEGEVGVINILTQDNLRVGVRTDELHYIVDSPVLIMGFVFDGNVPVIGTSAVVTIRDRSTGRTSMVVLKDDGQEADNLPGDGLYSGVYIADTPGDYSLVAGFSGVAGSGLAFNKEAYSSFSVRSPLANFNNSFTDQGIDTNGNDLFEYISLGIGVDAGVAGTYRITATLKGSNNVSRTVISIQQMAEGVNQSINIKFSKEDIFEIGVDGPYNVSEVVVELLENSDWFLADKVENPWETQPYSLDVFEKGGISLTGNTSDSGIDTDNDGRFDILKVNIEVNVLKTGSYQWSGRLVDSNKTEIDFSGKSGFLNMGLNIIDISFDGIKIGEKGINGPYTVTGFLMLGAGDSVIASDVATTQLYNFTDFEGVLNQPPIANAGPDQTLECAKPGGTSATLDGSASSDPDDNPLTYAWTGVFGAASGVSPVVFLPTGDSVITLVVNDGQVTSQPDTMNIAVEDTTPPEISLSCSPAVLWPPNHEMAEIIPTITVSDACDASVNIELHQITMNEGEGTDTYDPNFDGGVGDGNTDDDIQVTADGRIYLRAERNGENFQGRRYAIIYKAIDNSGNIAMDSCEVLVPHDQR